MLNFDLNGSAGGTPIIIKGCVRQPGPQATGWWEIKSTRWKQIDETLIAALPQAAQRFLRRLRPRGQIGFWARFERDLPVARPAVPHLILAIHDGWINYDAFPYPIGNIQGRIECHDGRWRFQDLQGWNDRCRIECNGAWLANDELRPLTLNLRAYDVVLDGDLRQAIQPELQQWWSDLQLQGTLEELDVQLQYSAASPRPRLDIRASQTPAASHRGVDRFAAATDLVPLPPDGRPGPAAMGRWQPVDPRIWLAATERPGCEPI